MMKQRLTKIFSTLRTHSQRWGDDRRASQERGDTLIEILLAIVVVGLAVTATLGAFATAISAATVQGGLNTLQGAVQNYADEANYAIELQPTPAFSALWCTGATPTTTSPYASVINYAEAGYSFSEVASFWNGTKWTDTGPCVSASGVDDPQRITFTAKPSPLTPKNASQSATYTIVVTSPQSPYTTGSSSLSGGGCPGYDGYGCGNQGSNPGGYGNGGGGSSYGQNGYGNGGFGSRGGRGGRGGFGGF